MEEAREFAVVSDGEDNVIKIETLFRLLDFQIASRQREVTECKYLIALQAASLIFFMTRFDKSEVLLGYSAASLLIFLSIGALAIALGLACISYLMVLDSERNIRDAIIGIQVSDLSDKAIRSELSLVNDSANLKRLATNLQMWSLGVFLICLAILIIPTAASLLN